jgi:3-phosphoshikimate 1-carboxyvinyltransferase
MNITITPSPLSGTLKVISSKSLSHRYVIASGLAKGKSTITNVLDSDDLSATKHVLSQLGTRFEGDHIIGSELKLNQKELDCNESGSTLRFMIPIVMLQKEVVTWTGKGRLKERPLDVYINLFEQKKITFQKPETGYLPLTVKGPLKAGHYPIKGNVSSQFITGLLYALPLLKKDSIIELTTPLESKGYVDLTLDVLQSFGIHILSTPPYYYIKGSQHYHPIKASIEGDYSQAAFWMVAGLIGKSITLKGLNPVSKQGDMRIVDLLKDMGGSIAFDHETRSYQIEPSATHGMKISLHDIPDLGPILMVLAALSSGTTQFEGCERLRIKESDRLQAMVNNLTQLGIDISVTGDVATIIGKPYFKGNQMVDAYDDHRIAMAMAIAAIRSDGPITIKGAQSVSKSYPNFYRDYQILGGIIHES